MEESARIGYLDSLRGLAALAVALFWHYQHFSPPLQPDGAPFSSAPFWTWPVLHGLYVHGYLAVDLFFLLSGIVFAHVYRVPLGDGRVGARAFFAFRFARLYPTHVLTLVLTAALAWSFHGLTGRFPVYQANTAGDFLLNLLFLQDGFTGRPPSFDAPSWSLSVEAFLYLLFFLWASRRGGITWPLAALGLGLLLWVSNRNSPFLLNWAIARGLIGFCAGVLLEHLARRGAVWPLLAAPAAAAVVSAGTPWLAAHRLDPAYPWCWVGFGTCLFILQRWPSLRRPLEWSPLRRLGDLSLAVYLIHFPVQVLLMLGCLGLGTAPPSASPAFWAAYATLVIAAAAALHAWFEVPVRAACRRALAPGRRSRLAPLAP